MKIAKLKNQTTFQNISIMALSSWLILLVLLPFLLVLLFSFLKRSETDFIQWQLTLKNYLLIFDPLYLKVFINSLLISLVTTFICLILGYPFAYFITKIDPRWRDLSLFLVVVPFWTNSLVRTYAIRILLGSQGFLNKFLLATGLIQSPLEILYTPLAVIIGTVYIYFPFMVLPLYAVLEKMPITLIEAAQDLGARPLDVFRKIMLPLSLPGIAAGSLLVFLPSLGCFYVADLLGGSRILLIGSVVRGQFLEARDWPFGSAISIALSTLMTLFVLLFLYGHKRTYGKKGEKHS